MIDSCELPRQMDGMVKVVVQHQRADSKPCRCFGHRHKWREGSGTAVDVIPRVHDIESEIFDSSGMRADLVEVEFARLKPKTKWAHVMSLPTRWATSRAATGNVCPVVTPDGERLRSPTRPPSPRRIGAFGHGPCCLASDFARCRRVVSAGRA